MCDFTSGFYIIFYSVLLVYGSVFNINTRLFVFVVALYHVFKSGSIMPPALFFWLKTALGIGAFCCSTLISIVFLVPWEILIHLDCYYTKSVNHFVWCGHFKDFYFFNPWITYVCSCCSLQAALEWRKGVKVSPFAPLLTVTWITSQSHNHQVLVESQECIPGVYKVDSHI